VVCAQLFEHVEPVQYRHVPVDERKVELDAFVQVVQSSLAIGSFLALDPLLLQQTAQEAAHKTGIVNNQCSHGYLQLGSNRSLCPS